MDIQSYIASGKLELFLLGELNEREREEVLTLAKMHPEIKKELEDLEQTMFAFDELNAPKPSKDVKGQIFATLEPEFNTPETHLPQEESKETKVISLTLWKGYAAAASVAAVLAIGAALFYATKFYEKDEQFTALLQEQSVMADNLNQVKMDFEQTETQLDKIVAGDYKRVEMKGEGFEMQKDAKVDVFWDQNAQEVFVAVNNLNSLSEEYDYQLWAIGDDGPIGIGLVNPGEKFTLQQMEAVAQAGAFAITIEQKGGSESPTLEKLVVLGEVA